MLYGKVPNWGKINCMGRYLREDLYFLWEGALVGIIICMGRCRSGGWHFV